MAADPFSTPRSGLFRRYAAVMMGLVGGALILQGILGVGFAYRASLDTAARVQRTEVRAAAERLEQYFANAGRDPAHAAAPALPSGLRYASDVVSGVAIGRSGRIYAVDGRDRLIAHPDRNVLLRQPDLRSYAPLQRIREELA